MFHGSYTSCIHVRYTIHHHARTHARTHTHTQAHACTRRHVCLICGVCVCMCVYQVYAKDEKKFFADFTKAYVKLTENGCRNLATSGWF